MTPVAPMRVTLGRKQTTITWPNGPGHQPGKTRQAPLLLDPAVPRRSGIAQFPLRRGIISLALPGNSTSKFARQIALRARRWERVKRVERA
jgi:hypothetical protein